MMKEALVRAVHGRTEGNAVKAAHYARRAGDRARTLLAYEAAASHYERALQALDMKGPGDPMLRGKSLQLGRPGGGRAVRVRARGGQ